MSHKTLLRGILVSACTWLWASTGLSQIPVDSAYTFIKYNSIHRNKADWDKTDRQFAFCISQASTTKDSMNCFVSVLKALNDVHSQLFYDNQVYSYYVPLEDSVYKKVKPLLQRAAEETNQPSFALLARKYLYIRIPSIIAYTQTDINRFAQSILDSLCYYSTFKPKGFIVDLRLNTGGNMYPMLSGLSPLLGNTITGYETDIADSVVRTWELRENNFIIGGYKATAIKNLCGTDFSDKPVVIITGMLTASSGTITAIAFKGRNKTFFTGEPTANGYSTSNGYFQFGSGLTMNFATSFVADRRMNICKTNLLPDLILTGGDNFDNPDADAKVIRALIWIKKLKK